MNTFNTVKYAQRYGQVVSINCYFKIKIIGLVLKCKKALVFNLTSVQTSVVHLKIFLQILSKNLNLILSLYVCSIIICT